MVHIGSENNLLLVSVVHSIILLMKAAVGNSSEITEKSTVRHLQRLCKVLAMGLKCQLRFDRYRVLAVGQAPSLGACENVAAVCGVFPFC